MDSAAAGRTEVLDYLGKCVLGETPFELSVISMAALVPKSLETTTIAALAIALFGCLYPVPALVEYYNVPPGTACRPMGLAMSLFLFGFGTPALAGLLVYHTIPPRGLNRWLSIFAVLLSCVPLPLHWFLIGWITDAHHLEWLP